MTLFYLFVRIDWLLTLLNALLLPYYDLFLLRMVGI